MHNQLTPVIRLLAVALGFCAATSLPAATYYKQNNTSLLCLGASWATNSGGTVAAGPPGAGDIATWDHTDTGSATLVGLATNSAWLGIQYGTAGTGSPTVEQVVPNSSGGTLTLGSSGINMSSATISFDFGANITFASGASQAWNIASGQTLELDGTINTSGNLLTVNQSGSGTVMLTSASTAFSAPITIDAGTLEVGNNTGGPNFNGGCNISDNGVFLVNLGLENPSSPWISTVVGDISGSGKVQVNAGALLLTGTNTFSGGTLINGGELMLGTRATSVSLNSLLGTGGVTNNGALIFNSGSTITISNIISGSGSGSLVISNGTAILSGANTYAGSTIINGGVLRPTSVASLGQTKNIMIGAGASLNASGLGGGLVLTSAQMLSAGTGNGTLNGSVNLGAGELGINYASSAALTVTNGTLTFSNNSIVVTVTGSALATGSYTLVTTANGGSLAGSVLSSYVVALGAGLAPSQDATVQLSSSALTLVVSNAPSSSISSYDDSMLPVIVDNLPAVGYITAYDVNEQTVANAAPVGEQPLYYPYESWDETNNVVYENSTNDAWWDNLVAEQLQARPSVVMLSTCGAYTTNLSDLSGPGSMNPRRLQFWVNAVNRAGATNVFRTGCFAEAAAQGIYDSYYSLPNSALCDFSNTDSWNQVWWLRIIKPWFDNVPSNTWCSVNGGIPVEFWGLNINSIYTNQQGNVSKMFSYLATNIFNTYGVWPRYIMGSINSTDTTLTNNPFMVGDNEWFSPPSTGYTMTPYKGYTWGGMVAGYINPNYYNPSSPQYGQTNTVLARQGVSSQGVYGANGDTMIDGLTAAVNTNAVFTIIEGYDDVSESCGPYRSLSTNWSYPNQYLDILRSYTDMRTVTTLLQAEGCDDYGNSPGNPFGVYRRTGTLGISQINGSGWAVYPTVAGEWIAFTNLQFTPGNYKFVVRYSSPAAHTLQLYIDGTAQPSITVPSTGGPGIFNTAYLATNTLSYGQHTLKVVFVDGGVGLDWLFAKKYDVLMSLQSTSTGNFLSAAYGGNGNNETVNPIVNNPTMAGAWEQFTIDDLSGNGNVYSGDTVNIQAYDGLYLTAENGGGGQLSCNRRVPGSWEGWTILNAGGGTGVLTNGAHVVFRSSSGTNYLTVASTNAANVSGGSIGSAQTFAIQISPMQAPPALAPSGLTATPASSNQVALTWNSYPNGSATVLAIERSTNDSIFSWVGYVGANATSFFDNGLATNVIYYYRILAGNPTGNSLPSYVATALLHAGQSTVQTEGDLIVNLQAQALNSGTKVWTNLTSDVQSVGNFTTSGGGDLNVATLTWNSMAVPALYVNGVGNNTVYSALNAPPEIRGAGSVSVEAWIYATQITNNSDVVNYGYQAGATHATDRDFTFDTGENGFSGYFADVAWGSSKPAAGAWEYIAYTYNGSTVNLYMNGVADGSGTESLNTLATPVNVGYFSFTSSNSTPVVNPFTGYIACVRVESGVLTSNNIASNYAAGPLAIANSGGGYSPYVTVAPPATTTPPRLSVEMSGQQLQIQWPPAYLGWELQVQTNSLVGTNWVTVPGSTGTDQMPFMVNPANGSVFFRLIQP